MGAIDKLRNVLGGSNAAIGRTFGISSEAVRKWERNGVPAERVLAIYRATGGAVTPHELRPDLYPDPDWRPPLDAGAGEEEAA